MSDLISRSELLNAMNTWDKFGCDCHSGLVRIDNTNNEEYVPFVHYEDMVNCVKNMPTAYDVDKIVEELEADSSVKLYGSGNSDNYLIPVKRAIEIVKQGGVSDDVCEWKLFDNSLTNEPQWVYETTCGKYVGEEHTSKAFVYCPYCGKKIKVVE